MKKKIVAAIATAAVALSLTGGAVASADDRKGGEKITSLLSSLVSKGTITSLKRMQLCRLLKMLELLAKLKWIKIGLQLMP